MDYDLLSHTVLPAGRGIKAIALILMPCRYREESKMQKGLWINTSLAAKIWGVVLAWKQHLHSETRMEKLCKRWHSRWATALSPHAMWAPAIFTLFKWKQKLLPCLMATAANSFTAAWKGQSFSRLALPGSSVCKWAIPFLPTQSTLQEICHPWLLEIDAKSHELAEGHKMTVDQ